MDFNKRHLDIFEELLVLQNFFHAKLQIIVVVKLSGDQAESKTKEGGGGDLGSERPLLHRPTLI